MATPQIQLDLSQRRMESTKFEAALRQKSWQIGIGAAVTRRPLPHHRAYGSVHGGSWWLRFDLIDQRRKSQRFEVRIGKPNREGFGPREIPGSKSTASRVTGQAWTNTPVPTMLPSDGVVFSTAATGPLGVSNGPSA